MTESSRLIPSAKNSRNYDVAVIGGGINGTGVARDAAGRGCSVLLCEQDDLGNYTSSSSTKLIHGGLRYLEHYDFKLVRHSLMEREVLLRSAPHIIWPLRFVLPHHKDLRPRWMIRMGLFLYDHLGKRELLPGSKSIKFSQHPAGKQLKPHFASGFEYSDCWVQDARLVLLNALDAKEKGAEIMTRTRCTGLQQVDDHWEVTCVRRDEEDPFTFYAKSVVNAAGPWVENVAGLNLQTQSAHGVRLVKGSHVIVKRLFDHDYAYIFQNSDGRVQFAIPYETNYTLLGTTDVEINGDPSLAEVSEQEIKYLCDNASQYFKQSVDVDDVVAKYVGVRPLFDDAAENASETTRDYVLHLNDEHPPILSIYGGKLTTYRVLAEQVMNMLSPLIGCDAPAWTAGKPLPGGDICQQNYRAFVDQSKVRYSWCDPVLVELLVQNYGTRIANVLATTASMEELGQYFGAHLYQKEVEYLIEQEWALSAEDILLRRTKAGLHGGEEIYQKLNHWLEKIRIS